MSTPSKALAADLACEIFGAPYAYVQPHSGIDANLVAFWAILAAKVESPFLAEQGVGHVNDLSEADWETLRHSFGDQRMIGMALDAGGHLTHGFRPNISGKLFQQSSYGVHPETGILDYDAVRALATEFRPMIMVAGYSAYPRRVDFAKMREIADEIHATLMVDMAHFAGLVAGGLFADDFDPIKHAHVITTTTHKSLRGPRGGMVFAGTDGMEFVEFIDKGCPMVLGGPMPQVMAAKAVAFAEAAKPEFADYSQRILDNAKALAEGLMKRDARCVTDGTDNHLVLVDMTSFGLTGRQAETALNDSGVIVIVTRSPLIQMVPGTPSGVRLGTPALTTLGMGLDEMDEVADIIVAVLTSAEAAEAKRGPSLAKYVIDERVQDACRSRAAALLEEHPLYPQVGLI